MTRRYAASSPVAYAQRMSLTSGSEGHCSHTQALESLVYFYDNSVNVDVPANASVFAKRILHESSSTWRLLVEIDRMEVLGERLRDQSQLDGPNPLMDAFIALPSFRRLIALIRWTHWVNNRELESRHETLQSSLVAYPQTSFDGIEIPLDDAVRQPDKIHATDLAREHSLCRQIWFLITQGRVMDAIELSSQTGHHWRSGVLNAACGHSGMAEETVGDDIPIDWVESITSCGLYGTDTGLTDDAGTARYQVKKTAFDILSKSSAAGIDEYDCAIMGYLCGKEDRMRRVVSGTSSFAVHLWVSLISLREELIGYLLRWDFNSKNRFADCDEADLDDIIRDSIGLFVSSLDTSMDLDSANQFSLLQSDLIVGDYESAIGQLSNWVSGGVIHLDAQEHDIEMTSPQGDVHAIMIIRQFSACLASVIRDMIAPPVSFDETVISSIVDGYIESLVSDLKSSGSLLENNQMVVDSISLFRDDRTKIKAWAWYLRQFMPIEWTTDNSVSYPPIVSLIETFPTGAISVLKLLLSDAVNRKTPTVLAHAFGSSIEAGKEIAFALGCLNSLWLVAQSAAKSTGNGIYVDIFPNGEDPDDAATCIVSSISDMFSEGMMVLVLADFQSAKQVLSLTHAPYLNKVLSIQTANDSIQAVSQNEEASSMETVSSFVQILERVTMVMERSSLLDQQKANMTRLTGKTNATRLHSSMSTDTRRQVLEGTRLIDSSNEMINRLIDDILTTLGEYLKSKQCPIDNERSVLEIADWQQISSAVIDVVLDSTVQAIAACDDRKRQNTLVKQIKACSWTSRFLNESRIEQLLEEIAKS
jgi:hypothetical protein